MTRLEANHELKRGAETLRERYTIDSLRSMSTQSATTAGAMPSHSGGGTAVRANADRLAIERWEDEGGTALPARETKPMSSSNSRTMTEFDLRRLDALFQRIRTQVRPPATLSLLEREVTQAAVVNPQQVPPTVVTMNSEVEVVDMKTHERRCLTVVFPSTSGIEAGHVSVLAPLGTALIGSCEGASVVWPTPRGPRQLKIERVVYQPEASGRFDL